MIARFYGSGGNGYIAWADGLVMKVFDKGSVTLEGISILGKPVMVENLKAFPALL